MSTKRFVIEFITACVVAWVVGMSVATGILYFFD